MKQAKKDSELTLWKESEFHQNAFEQVLPNERHVLHFRNDSLFPELWKVGGKRTYKANELVQ